MRYYKSPIIDNKIRIVLLVNNEARTRGYNIADIQIRLVPYQNGIPGAPLYVISSMREVRYAGKAILCLPATEDITSCVNTLIRTGGASREACIEGLHYVISKFCSDDTVVPSADKKFIPQLIGRALGSDRFYQGDLEALVRDVVFPDSFPMHYPELSALLKYCGEYFCSKCRGVHRLLPSTKEYNSRYVCDACHAKLPRVLSFNDRSSCPIKARNKTAFCVGSDDSPKPLFLGVELEVEARKSDRQELFEYLGETIYDYAICKPDGSLGSGGAEIVTVPGTLTAHKELIWPKFFEKQPHKVMRGWEGYQCGMHIHIELKHLSEETVGKMLVFINSGKNTKFIDCVAGRPPTCYCVRDPNKTVDHGRLSNRRSNHYDALSFSAHTGKTIELRIFKSNVNQIGFYKNVEFADAFVRFCQETPANECTPQKLCEYILLEKNSKLYGNLIAFLHKSKKMQDPTLCQVDMDSICMEA